MPLERPLAIALAGFVASAALTPLSAQRADSSAAPSRALSHAIEVADTSSLVQLLDSTAVLIESDGSRVAGNQAVGRALLQTRFGPGHYAMLYDASASAVCTEGGSIENGRYAITRQSPGGSEGMETGTLALRWIVRDRQWRVNAIALLANGGAQAATQKLNSTCGRLDLIVFARRRFELSLMPTSISSSTSMSQLESSLSARGWSRSAAFGLFPLSYRPDPGAGDGRINPKALWLVGLAVRVADHVRIMATFQPAATSSRLLSYNEVLSSRLNEVIAFRESSVELVGDWKGFRTGLGAARISSSIQERYENLVLHSPTSVAGDPSLNAEEMQNYSPASLGAIGSLEYTKPLSNRLSASIIARSRYGSALQVPGVQTHRDWSYGVSGSYVGVLFATGW